MTTHVVVMGVSGSGKTTVAEGVADRTGWIFAEADAFHPQANIDKMASGTPLTDEDRWPWLESIGEWISAKEGRGESAVVTCSALRRVHRDLADQDDLLEVAALDAIRRARDRVLVVLGRHHRRDLGLARRRRVEHRQRLLDQLTQARLGPREVGILAG